MAPAGFRTFVAGDILTAAQVNDYLMQQSVTVFASAIARDAAISTPAEGQACFLTDTNYFQLYDGTAWTNVVSASGAAAVNRVEIVKFTATGSFSKSSYPWATYAEITVVGSGGAGGGAENNGFGSNDYSMGSGGGAGGTAIVYVTLASLAVSETVTIGAGGLGVAGADGNWGNSSSFGTLAVATGGEGGLTQGIDSTSQGQGKAGGLGGVGTTGDLLLRGGAGGPCWLANTETGFSGGGGLSSFGGYGNYNVAPETGSPAFNGTNADVPGAGGGGALDSNGSSGSEKSGGNGADGIVVVKLT